MDRIFKAENYIEKGMSVGIFRAESDESESEHTHEFAEIIYILDGRARQSVNGTVREVCRGDLIFINCGSTHSYEASEKFSYYNICFKPEIIAERIINRDNAFDLLSLTAIDEIRKAESAEWSIRFDGEARRTIETILADMEREFCSNYSERAAVMESYMTVIIAKILRKTESVAIAAAESGKLWRELTEYIDSNIGERLTLDELAKKCFYNPSYFSRCFKDKFGTTLSDYIARARTEKAAKLLVETELSADDIASSCGFCDRTALYRAFAKQYGMSLREYRESKCK